MQRLCFSFIALPMLFVAVAIASSCSNGEPTKVVTPPADPACKKHDPSLPKPIPGQFTVVHVEADVPPPVQLAVQACAGLHNRNVGGSVYIDATAHDGIWLDDLGMLPAATVSAQEFLDSCVTAFPTCVRYDYKNQQALLPNILTAAAALGAVPLATSVNIPCDKPVFDALVELKDNTPAEATKAVFDKFVKETTGLAMLNPGYDQQSSTPESPAMTGEMKPALIDFVFSQKLFVLFLVNGCTEGNPEKELLSNIVNAGHWATPVGVYGYNNSWLVGGGYLHEAQTRCLDSRNMGAIPSEVGNLSFFGTRLPPITESGVVEQNELEPIVYDSNKTYVAFVVGDGDNIQFVMTTRHDWFEQRVTDCETNPEVCPPLTWSISPHLTHVAPEVLAWYYEQSHRTKKDYFILPPSGHLYAYPSSMAEEAQNEFVKATDEDACVLGVNGVVHWDWIGTWEDAEGHFLPKYARPGGSVRGVFPVNVPYLFPIFTWWPADQYFEVLTDGAEGKVALFRPRSWRGIDKDTDQFRLSPQKMATEISGYPKGTIAWVYMTSDGGLTLQNSFLTLAKLLPPHVQLVSTDTAAKLAIATKTK